MVAARLDPRWQLVLGCLGVTEAPFSQGALVKFRERMIAHDVDRKLLDRTVALAKETGRFGWQALRAALDSSPLVGAGRVEDTWNLLGRALRAVVTCAATTLKIPRDQVLQGAGVTLLGAPSLKAALDIDWTDPAAQTEALAQLLAEVDRVEVWVAAHVAVTDAPTVQAALTALRRVLAQDLEPDPTTGQRRIRRGVAADRMPSLGDPEMRHGRKTRTKLFTGYKRHVITLVDADLIVGAVVCPANEPEHHALAVLEPDVVLLSRHARKRTLAPPSSSVRDFAGTSAHQPSAGGDLRAGGRASCARCPRSCQGRVLIGPTVDHKFGGCANPRTADSPASVRHLVP